MFKKISVLVMVVLLSVCLVKTNFHVVNTADFSDNKELITDNISNQKMYSLDEFKEKFSKDNISNQKMYSLDEFKEEFSKDNISNQRMYSLDEFKEEFPKEKYLKENLK